MTRVLIIEAQMKQYRVPFFQGLYSALRGDGVQLCVAYSDPPQSELNKKDNVDLSPDYGIKVKAYWVLGRLIWQPLWREVCRSDLIIVEPANKFVLNQLLFAMSAANLKKVAFWGLGENKQADRSAISEWYKRRSLNWVDHWFAYTRGTADYLNMYGVPAEKITAVQNSVDTRELRAFVHDMSRERVYNARRRLGIPDGALVGTFCGMLDKVKDVPFLLQAAELIRDRLASFHLLIAGGGPEQSIVEKMAARHEWVHCVGPKFGREKALMFALSDAFLLPGRVGLAILDAFASGLPLLTTKLPIHGPEIEYLQNGYNGIMTEHTVASYASAVTRILSDRAGLRQMKRNALESGGRYSIEAMVGNFRLGIHKCLGLHVEQYCESVTSVANLSTE